jgi:hypothetical protein
MKKSCSFKQQDCAKIICKQARRHFVFSCTDVTYCKPGENTERYGVKYNIVSEVHAHLSLEVERTRRTTTVSC